MLNSEITKLVLKFQKDPSLRNTIIAKLSNIILKIPPGKNYFDEDIKQDFLLFIMCKIDKILHKYQKRENCSFITWFYIVLNRQFSNFIYNYKRKKIKNGHFNFDNLVSDENIPCLATFSNDNFLYLSKNEQNILKYKYGIDNHSQNFAKMIVTKLEKKNEIEDKLNWRFVNLLKIQKEKKSTFDKEIMDELNKREQKVIHSKRRLEKIYNRYHIFPTNKWVSEQLDISYNTVSTYVKRIRDKIKIQIN